MNSISPILGTGPLRPVEFLKQTGQREESGFRQVLRDAIQSVETAQANASAEIDRLLTGNGGELHSAVLAAERAELQFQLFLQVRNKVMSAYQQIMQTQV